MTEMQRNIVFASNNAHKLQEMRRILGASWNVLSLKEIGCTEEIAETATTLRGNAEIKARYVKERYGYDCFADDTGLIVEALGGAPGVYSARYAGEECNSQANMALLLKNLEGISDRRAKFQTVIALAIGDEIKYFEGEVEGQITERAEGDAGFGYDPVFRPTESDVTFASMSEDEKNSISHRGRATRKLIDYLTNMK